MTVRIVRLLEDRTEESLEVWNTPLVGSDARDEPALAQWPEDEGIAGHPRLDFKGPGRPWLRIDDERPGGPVTDAEPREGDVRNLRVGLCEAEEVDDAVCRALGHAYPVNS